MEETHASLRRLVECFPLSRVCMPIPPARLTTRRSSRRFSQLWSATATGAQPSRARNLQDIPVSPFRLLGEARARAPFRHTDGHLLYNKHPPSYSKTDLGEISRVTTGETAFFDGNAITRGVRRVEPEPPRMRLKVFGIVTACSFELVLDALQVLRGWSRRFFHGLRCPRPKLMVCTHRPASPLRAR